MDGAMIAGGDMVGVNRKRAVMVEIANATELTIAFWC
jgi:hypothetical protein